MYNWLPDFPRFAIISSHDHQFAPSCTNFRFLNSKYSSTLFMIDAESNDMTGPCSRRVTISSIGMRFDATGLQHLWIIYHKSLRIRGSSAVIVYLCSAPSTLLQFRIPSVPRKPRTRRQAYCWPWWGGRRQATSPVRLLWAAARKSTGICLTLRSAVCGAGECTHHCRQQCEEYRFCRQGYSPKACCSHELRDTIGWGGWMDDVPPGSLHGQPLGYRGCRSTVELLLSTVVVKRQQVGV